MQSIAHNSKNSKSGSNSGVEWHVLKSIETLTLTFNAKQKSQALKPPAQESYRLSKSYWCLLASVAHRVRLDVTKLYVSYIPFSHIKLVDAREKAA